MSLQAERYLSGEQETRLEAEASSCADRHRTGPGPERGGGGVTGLCDRLAVIEAPDAAVGRSGSGGGARETFPPDVSAVAHSLQGGEAGDGDDRGMLRGEVGRSGRELARPGAWVLGLSVRKLPGSTHEQIMMAGLLRAGRHM
jgi:hypothetical protein